MHERLRTTDIALHLADAASRFPYLGPITVHDLLALVHAELGNAQALDDFRPYGGHLAKAVPVEKILHIISGNTPAAGLQSLMRGLLLGARNMCKIPSTGMPEIAAFKELLPPILAGRVEIVRDLPDSYLARADAVIVFGSDETIEHFRALIRPGQIFLPHGHRLSFGVIFDDPEADSAAAAAQDTSVFDQQGCLSPHVFFVAQDPLTYATRLATEMERLHILEPRGVLSLSEANAIRNQRAELVFRAANDEPVAIFQSAGSTAWTVVFDPAPGFPHTPLNRFVYVKPLPEDLGDALWDVRSHLSCVGIWPATMENIYRVSGLGVSRICEVGRMQLPPTTWHQDGQQVLAPLVRWVDCELED